jgi:hypothetical protein
LAENRPGHFAADSSWQPTAPGILLPTVLGSQPPRAFCRRQFLAANRPGHFAADSSWQPCARGGGGSKKAGWLQSVYDGIRKNVKSKEVRKKGGLFFLSLQNITFND